MRSGQLKHAIGIVFSLACLAVPGAGCTGTEGGSSAESTAGEEVTAEPAASHATGAERLAELGRMEKVDHAQLLSLLGDKVPAAAGDSCSTLGTTCGAPINAITRACGGFQGVCGSTGTEDFIPLAFFCLPNGAGGGVCTAVVSGPQQTRGCTVPSDGKACSTGCGAEHCDVFSTTCDVDTNKIRTCQSGGTCSNNQCVNQATTIEVTGTCERDTEGQSCSQSEIRPIGGLCSPPRQPICAPDHFCRCLTGPV